MKHERRQYVAFGSIEGEINGKAVLATASVGRVTCSCGWKVEKSTGPEALAAFEVHVRQMKQVRR